MSDNLCAWCQRPIPRRCASDDFCQEFCQTQWTRRHYEAQLWWDPDEHMSQRTYQGWNRWC